MSSISLVRASQRRKLLAGLAAAAACAGLSAAAQDAQAAFSLPACGGSNAAKNQGGTFQTNAQAYWRTVFASSNGCSGAVSLQGFLANGSGNGLAAMGAGGGNASISCASSCGATSTGIAAGIRDPTTAFSSTDEPPTPTQQAAMNAGTDAATDDALVHVIPAATGSAAVILHAPNGCVLSTVTNRTGNGGTGADSDRAATGDTLGDLTQRPHITSALIEKAFAGATDADTWGELAPGISGTPTGSTQNSGNCADIPVKRIVRQDNSGTTYAFKAYLNLINPSRGWLTTYNPAPNTVWPAAGGSGLASPVPTAAATNNVCGNTTTNGNPNPNLLCSASSSGGGGLADVTNATEGAIGYVDLATARGKNFDITPAAVGGAQDYTFWIPLQNNPTTTSTGYVEPTADPTAHKSTGVGARGANCGDAPVSNVPTPANSPKNDPTLGDWSKAFAAGGSGYPNCVLTYILAWDDSAAAYGNTADEQGKARSVKDFLTTSVVSSAGQQFANVDYSSLPNPQSQPLLKYAQDGVAAIDWNKSAVVAPAITTTTPPTTPVTPPTTPKQTAPTVVAPSNAFSIGTGVASKSRTSLAFTVKLPGAGKLVAAATYKSGSKTVKIATLNATTTSAGSAKVTVKLSSKARSVLKKKKKLAITVKFTFTPVGGTPRSGSRTVTIRPAPGKKKSTTSKE